MPPASGCSTSARAPDHGHVAAGPPRREPRPGHPLRRRRGQEARAHPHLGHGWRAPRVGRGARGGDGAGGAGQTGRGDCGRVDAVWRLPVQQVCPVVPARRQVPKRALALVLLCNLLPAPDGGAQPAAPAHLLARLRSVHARARPAPRRLDAPADAARPPRISPYLPVSRVRCRGWCGGVSVQCRGWCGTGTSPSPSSRDSTRRGDARCRSPRL
mmetsp:Transcript_36210/g.119314  ORF Transcript_36210/g.119314 Transcript_36210/m.119314 type:complete len:214 (+) Transcript_36210:514-1155(+)